MANRLILAGLICMLAPSSILLYIENDGALLVGTLMALVMLGFGLLSPASNHIAMGVIDQGKGKASGIIRLFQMSAAALVSSLYALLMGIIGSLSALALLVLLSALSSLIFWLLLVRYRPPHTRNTAVE